MTDSLTDVRPWRLGARRVFLGCTTAAVLLFAVLTALGPPSWLSFVVSSLPWLVALRERFGAGLAVATVFFVDLWLVLSLTMLTAAVHLPMLGTLLMVFTVVGLVGVWQCRGMVFSIPAQANAAVWLPALIGPVVWFASMVANDLLPGTAKLTWVMRGDSPNNLLFAREIIYRSGIGVGPNENPVPLPSALLAVSMESGRSGVASAELLRHDITAFSNLWILLIAVTCLTAGVVASSLTRSVTNCSLVIGVISGAASLLPLSWLFTSLPLEYGFFSSHVAFPIAFVAFIAFLGSRAHPAMAFGLLCLGASLLFAVWSPLVLLPAALAVMIVIQQWRQLVATRGAALVWVTLCSAQLVLYAFGVVLPSLLHLRGFLIAQGATFVLPHAALLVVGVGAVFLGIVAFRSWRSVPLMGVVAVVGGSVAALGALLFLTRHEPSPWTYYPLKFLWMATVICLVLLIGLIPAALVSLRDSRPVRMLSVAVVVALAAAVVLIAPPSDALHRWTQPVLWILAGQVTGRADVASELILRGGNLEKPTLYWQSRVDDQDFVNFWLLEVAANSMTKSNALRVFSYGIYDEKKVSDLCKILVLLPKGATIQTSNSDLEALVKKTCPSREPNVAFSR